MRFQTLRSSGKKLSAAGTPIGVGGWSEPLERWETNNRGLQVYIAKLKVEPRYDDYQKPEPLAPTTSTPSTSDIVVEVDGVPLVLDFAPIMVNSRVLVPYRAIAEALGAEVEWDESTRTVSLISEATTVRLTIGSDQALVNDEPIAIGEPALIVQGRTRVPLRFISTSLGAEINWDGATRTAKIVSR